MTFLFLDIFYATLSNLSLMLKRCKQTNLVLNQEKCHFIVQEDILLGHRISFQGIGVDRAKVNVIAKLSSLFNVKGVRNFLWHVSFYRCFIKFFSFITKSLCNFIVKHVPFIFDSYLDICKCTKSWYVIQYSREWISYPHALT